MHSFDRASVRESDRALHPNSQNLTHAHPRGASHHPGALQTQDHAAKVGDTREARGHAEADGGAEREPSGRYGGSDGLSVMAAGAWIGAAGRARTGLQAGKKIVRHENSSYTRIRSLRIHVFAGCVSCGRATSRARRPRLVFLPVALARLAVGSLGLVPEWRVRRCLDLRGDQEGAISISGKERNGCFVGQPPAARAAYGADCVARCGLPCTTARAGLVN